MRRISSLFIFFIFISHAGWAQKSKKDKKSAQPESSFDCVSLNKLLVTGINAFRLQNGYDSLDLNNVLESASSLSSIKMADAQKADATSLDKNTPRNLKASGGSGKGEEIIIVCPITKGKTPATPADIVKTILLKWENSKKEKDIILNASNTYIGVTCGVDKAEIRVYISAVFGGYQALNTGVKHKKELKVPFNTKSKKLLNPDPRHCKNCDKFKDFEALHAGLTVENGKIYLLYNNIKNLKRLLKKPSDGLAVDIVQKEQYNKEDYNIMDNSLRNKGVMLKVIKKDKLFAKNLIKPDNPKKKNQKVNKLKVDMGVFPKAITGAFELNLIVVQDGYVCRTVLRSYMEFSDQLSSPIEMLPMPESVGAITPPFEPRSESALLNFDIPFEKNKFEFKKEDVQPFITAMQEPDFIIDGLFIYAYSSIEGDSVANSKLQRKRAESVVKVLQQMQKNKISPVIITNDSWDLFRLEMEDGKYDYLTRLNKHEAINKINHVKRLTEELESALAKERFAQIVMDVTYDISGKKEERFSLVQFNRAVKADNLKQAYRIMDYIAKKIKEGKYSSATFDKMEIGNDTKNVGLLMNKVYYKYILAHKVVDDEEYKAIQEIQKLDASNSFVNYNALYCKIELDSNAGSKTEQGEMQLKIDALYKSELPKKTVDGLNIQWQFKILDALDTLDGAEIQRQECIDKIKSFYNFKEASKQNAAKLAYAFARAKDFKFACTILEPYLSEADDKILYAYVSIASHVPEHFFSHKFANALAEIKQRHPDKFCKLFGEPFMSFQVLDNPTIKKTYKEASCGQ